MSVAWGNGEREGIVAELSDASAESAGMPLKPVSSPFSPVPWSTPEWVSVATAVARRNFLPIHTVFALGLPADVRRRFAKKGACAFSRAPRTGPGAERLLVPKGRAEALAAVAERILSGAKIAALFPDDAMLGDFLAAHPDAAARCHVSKNSDGDAKRASSFAACALAERPFLGPRARLTWPLAGYDGLVLVEDALAPQISVSRRPVWCRDFCAAWQAAGLPVETVASVPLPDTVARLLPSGSVRFA